MEIKSIWKKIKGFFKANAIAAMFLILFLLCCVSFDNFLSVEAIANLLRSSSVNGLLAVGMMFVILCGDIDLSVGSVLALAGIVFVKVQETSVILGILAALIVGILCGLLTGFLTIKAGLPAFISSLSTQYAFRGLVYMVTNQKAVTVLEPGRAFSWLGNGSVLGFLPTQAFFFLVIALICGGILKYTIFGRSVYAAGGNTEAALMMGVKTDRTRISAFLICGGLSALAGVVTASRLGSAQAVAGEGAEMIVIAGIVLGGTLLRGGVGRMSGVVFGTLFIRLVTTAFNNIPGISSYWQNVITGILLLIVVFLQNYGMELLEKRRLLKQKLG